VDQRLDDLTQVVAEGHKPLVFSQFTRFLRLVRDRLDQAGLTHSYLDGEADQQRQLPMQPNGITEDGLWFWVRGWSQPLLAPGEVKAVPMLTSAEPGPNQLRWTNAQLKHAPLTKKIAVDGQQIDADLFTVQIMNGPRKDFYVERGGQRRILRWDFSTGERGQLIKSARLKYWEMAGKGGEAALKQLGVLPRPVRTM